MAHHPIVLDRVDEIFAKDSNEPLTGGAGFC